MADKKKNASRGQMAEPRMRTSEKEEVVKTVAREERKARKEQPRQESKSARTDKRSPGWLLRIRNSRIGRFVLDAYYELRHKVTWPTFQQARNMTLIVIALSVVIGGILALLDYGLYQLFLLISGGR